MLDTAPIQQCRMIKSSCLNFPVLRRVPFCKDAKVKICECRDISWVEEQFRGVSCGLNLFHVVLSLSTTYRCKSCSFVQNKSGFPNIAEQYDKIAICLVSKAAGPSHWSATSPPPSYRHTWKTTQMSLERWGHFLGGWSFPSIHTCVI